MKPKPPIVSLPKINLPDPPVPNLPPMNPADRPGVSLDTTPVLPTVPGTGPGRADPSLPAWPPSTDLTLPPTPNTGADVLFIYRLSSFSAGLLPVPGQDGFRVQAHRYYADIQSGETVLVGFDVATGQYRAKLRNEQNASGPALLLNADGKTWRLDSSVNTSRPMPVPDVQQAGPSHKRPLIDEQQPGPSNKRPLIDEQPGASLPATPPGGPARPEPFYVERARKNEEQRVQLLEQLKDRFHSRNVDQSLKEVALTMQPYNMSNQQIARLLDEYQSTGVTPQWAKDHKQTSMDKTSTNRFGETYDELLAEILSLRNTGAGFADFDVRFSRPYFIDLLAHAGYRRNKFFCLYRTDIPAMFRGDDRTPFEFTRDGHMLPRKELGEGSTSQQAVSTSFSLRDAKRYISHFGKQSGIEELLYNTQHHKYPGDMSNAGQGNVVDSDAAPDSGSDSRSSTMEIDVTRITEKDYYPKRHNQNFAFVYLLDTRNIEVVPGRENYRFNREALEMSRQAAGQTWFPDDDLEGHVSVSKHGFSAERIWLVNSTGTRAARVKDLYAQSYDHSNLSFWNEADVIEERTWAGAYNMSDYDDLIDQVADANKPVINFPAGVDIYANDVLFPPI
jgi:hypothetical protein